MSVSLRMMPTRFCMTSCSSAWIAYGFSPWARVKGASVSCDRLELSVVDGEPAAKVLGIERGVLAGPAPEDEEVGEGVAAEPVAAVHTARALAGGEQPLHRRLGGVGVDADTAHHVEIGRAHV